MVWIERKCHRQRPQESLGGLTPVEYEDSITTTPVIGLCITPSSSCRTFGDQSRSRQERIEADRGAKIFVLVPVNMRKVFVVDVAEVNEGLSMTLESLRVGNALDLQGTPISAAILTSQRVYTAGILPLDPVTGEVVEGGIDAQAPQAMANLLLILDAAGCTLADVITVEVYLADIGSDLKAFNRVYSEVLGAHHPARVALGVELAWPSLAVELRVVAERSTDRGQVAS